MRNKPDKAFILAAGKGTRLRPQTDTMPKPMVPIAGRSIIKRTIEKLAKENVEEIVVNLHHLGDVLADHLKDVTQPKIVFSREDELLETGGGLKKALHHFGDQPFYSINGDALWDEERETAFSRLGALWDEDKMDILLFLEPKEKMVLTKFVGDYRVGADGRLDRAKNKDGTHMYAGVSITHPRVFENSPDGAFSFLQLMDKAQEQGRLYGMAHDAEWYHISTPEDLAAVDAAFRQKGDL